MIKDHLILKKPTSSGFAKGGNEKFEQMQCEIGDKSGNTTSEISNEEIEKKLKAKLENGITLGDIAQMFMLEPDEEKQKDLMKDNTFKLPGVVGNPTEKASNKDKNKLEKGGSERDCYEDDESSGG